MKKEEFNSRFRDYIKNNISIDDDDRVLIQKIYQSINDLLGINNCIQIGSYPRFTSIRPIHDLDVLYILGNWDENSHTPQKALNELFEKIDKEYKNPTKYTIESSEQTHSITILFKDNNVEIFSVDIVPAYIFSKNEFLQDMYKVPEILNNLHGGKKEAFYKKLSDEHKDMDWINTDPRSYIKIATDVNSKNDDFRKTVKFIKAWKNACKKIYPNFKLKSFHVEQIIIKYFQDNSNDFCIYDAIFKFFIELPDFIKKPLIKDRADNDKYIDDYLEKLSDEQRNKIKEGRDAFLVVLEEFSENNDIENLISSGFYSRRGDKEQFLFDFNIPVLINDSLNFEVDGFIKKKDGFRDGWLSSVNNNIAKKRNINFVISKDIDKDFSMWKVQNDKKSKEIINDSRCFRGEITRDSTLYYYETTSYTGNHYVECFAILNSECIARAKRPVNIV